VSLTGWLHDLIDWTANRLPATWWLAQSFNIKALLIIVLVSVICGAVGALVVGNRMSFFSDALAHCAFAGVALGMLTAIWLDQPAAEAWAGDRLCPREDRPGE
jgi:zinc transport system permease protein